MTDLSELIDRVERADGSDFWLDRAICELVRPEDAIGPTQPDYTASLDAAMTLVPEDCEWTVKSNGAAHVWKAGAYYAEVSEHAVAATPALALAAAALRAGAALTLSGRG